jgi:RNA polymerase sigma factor (sigma-70 family)
MSPPSPFPSAEEGLSLHLRLCALDPLAPADLCRACLDPLVHWLETRFPRVDPHLREAAAGEALFAYVRAPHRYHPERAALPAYLRMAARRDLLNLLRRERRHHQHRLAWPVVELGEEGGNLQGREEEPSRQMEDEEEEERWQALLRAVRERCTEEERRVLDLMLAGQTSTAVFAEAVGLGDRQPAGQEREVKKVKDRLKKRLEREGGKHG